jgi:chloride channel 3/4/5
MILSLLVATVLRTFLVIVSYGCKVPAGIFVPSMAIGASFGRMVGILVQWLYEQFPDSRFFSTCHPDAPCITPGTYAFLGAGAALSGIMHITVSVTVIMFELTGALTYILPTMIVVGVTKAVGDRFSKGGIADRMIWFNGFPFLDNKEEHSFGVPVSRVMTTNMTVLPALNFGVKAAEKLLEDTNYSGFPIVEDMKSMTLLGYIGRTELRFAIDRARKQGLMSPSARCAFIPEALQDEQTPTSIAPPITFDGIATSSGQQTVDFSQFVDSTPLAVHPQLPLETVMELFKKMGPRVILVEHHGQLTGLVTVKDCLKYQFKVEAQEHSRDDSSGDAGQERLWDAMQKLGDWIADRVLALSSGRLKLSPRMAGSGNTWAGRPEDETTALPLNEAGGDLSDHRQDRDTAILEGTEDVHEVVELDDR